MDTNDSPLRRFGYKLRDAGERMFWTVVSLVSGTITTVALPIPEEYQAISIIVLSAVSNALTLVARNKLKTLPDPGSAIAEEVATEVYRQITVGGDPNLNLDLDELAAEIQRMMVESGLIEEGVDLGQVHQVVLDAIGSPIEEGGELIDGGA